MSASSVRRSRFSTQAHLWEEAVDEALAHCESGGIDPRHYFKSVAQTMGIFCRLRKMPLVPQHIRGPGAIQRYNRWLSRQRAQNGSADAVFSTKNDVRLQAELAFVEVYSAMLASHASPKKARRVAKAAAVEVDSEYRYCRLRRIIALSDLLHRLHPSLPDMLALRDGWTTREILTKSFVLTVP